MKTKDQLEKSVDITSEVLTFICERRKYYVSQGYDVANVLLELRELHDQALLGIINDITKAHPYNYRYLTYLATGVCVSKISYFSKNRTKK